MREFTVEDALRTLCQRAVIVMPPSLIEATDKHSGTACDRGGHEQRHLPCADRSPEAQDGIGGTPPGVGERVLAHSVLGLGSRRDRGRRDEFVAALRRRPP